MIGKLAGSAYIVAATSGIGYSVASRYEKRIKNLKGFQSGMWLLKSEIDFSMTMLPLALKKCATLVAKNVAEVFCVTAQNIENGMTTFDAWCDALDRTKSKLYLKPEDIDVLIDFSKKLGSGDAETEINNIELAMERLAICEKNALENSIKSSKLCKTAGVTAGLFIVVLLL